MLKTEEIKKIELGPRQLFLFDLEKRTVVVHEEIFSQVTKCVQARRQVQALAFSESAADGLGESAFTVLQHLFWLAHDMKIQFTSAGQAISPNQARSRMIHSPEMPVELTLNQSVEGPVLGHVKGLLDQIDPEADGEAPRNENELAHRLIRKLGAWKALLEVCRTRARRQGFPGKEAIDSALAFIRTLSAKLDAVSLIHTFYEHADALARLDAEVTSLARFYDKNADHWQMLLQFARQAIQTLETFEEDANITAAYQRFKQIMTHPRPYHRVDEACRLQQTLEPCHKRILAELTEKQRAEALVQIKALIQKMKIHLDSHAADADMRNQSLYALRQHLKAVESAPTVRRIHRRMRLAEEDYEQCLDAVSGG